MRRRPDNWPKALFAYLAEHEAARFEWGAHDCVLFAAGWMERLGHAGVLDGLGPWSSALGAARVMRARGGFDEVVKARMAALHCPAVPPPLAQRGDVALVEEERGRHALGIVTGNKVACQARVGLAILPLTAALAAWRV